MAQKDRRQFLDEFAAAFGTAATISISGCLGFGNGETEPDQLPRGLTERGIEFEILAEKTATSLESADYHVVGVANGYADDGTHTQTILEMGKMNDRDSDGPFKSVVVSGRIDEEVDSLDPDRFDESYDPTTFEGNPPEISFRVDRTEYVKDHTGDVTTGDPGRSVDERMHRPISTALQHIEQTIWNPPEWDSDLGVYVLDNDSVRSGFTGNLNEAVLHVNAEGIPTYVYGDITRTGSIRAEAVLRPSGVEVDVPEWVES